MLMVERRLARELRARSRRRHRTRKELGERARAQPATRLTDEEKRNRALLDEMPPTPRPRNRGECRDMERPCPYVGCRHHLYLEVLPSGAIKLNHPGREIADLHDSCSLDVAERGAVSQEWAGVLLNLTHTRVEQIEVESLLKLRGVAPNPDEIGAVLHRNPGQ